MFRGLGNFSLIINQFESLKDRKNEVGYAFYYCYINSW